MSEAVPVGMWQRAWRRLDVRIGTIVVACMIALGIYAPFLANDVPILGGGRISPVISDFFNRRSYNDPYDLLFNIMSVTLPIIAVAWFVLRKRWSWLRIALMSGTCIAAVWVLCQLPVQPTAQGWQPLWRDRPFVAVDASAWSLATPIPHRATVPYAGATLLSPGTRNPATQHRFWLGTDLAGHDVAARMLHGTRSTMAIACIATGLSLLIGFIIGSLSGLLGGWVDLTLQRIVEIMMCFPTFLLILAIVAVVGRDFIVIAIVIGVTGWAGAARLVRGEYLVHGARDYVYAARVSGVTSFRLITRHILPNVISPLTITAAFALAGAVGLEAGLGFVGMGDPVRPSWGGLLSEGRENIACGWLIYPSSAAILVLVLALMSAGNGLREAFDAKGDAR